MIVSRSLSSLKGALLVSCVSLMVGCGAANASGANDDTNDDKPAATAAVAPDTATGSGAPRSGDRHNDGTTPTNAGSLGAGTSVIPAPTSAAAKLAFRGVNLSGAEFGSALPGREGSDYTWPTTSEVDYFVAKGMNTFRINFMWERLQPSQYGDFDEAYGAKLDAIVSYATEKHAAVLLNPQNFARYYGTTIGSASVPNEVFADFWRRVADRYKANPRIMFGLVNEPHDIDTNQWVGAANAAIAAIRGTGATNTINVPGNAWTGAHSWAETWYGTSNAVALLNVVDSGNNMVFEAHQYLDSSSGGYDGTCVSTTAGRERLQPFVEWLRANGKKGFIGEFAGGNNATCNVAIADMLNAMEDASDVLNGWLWWGGGPWWGDYDFSIEPRTSGADAAQMSLLTPRLANVSLF